MQAVLVIVLFVSKLCSVSAQSAAVQPRQPVARTTAAAPAPPALAPPAANITSAWIATLRGAETAAVPATAGRAAAPVLPELAPEPALSPQQIQAGLLKHNGHPIFLTGVNIGNVQFIPFEGNPYGYPADRLRGILGQALADIAATGANSIRFWLHIDGSRSPAWGPQVTLSLRCGVSGIAYYVLTARGQHQRAAQFQ